MGPGVEEGEEHDAKNATVTRHSTLHEFEKHQGVLHELLGSIEEEVAQAPAQHNAKHRGVDDEVRDLLLGNLTDAATGKLTHKNHAGHKP